MKSIRLLGFLVSMLVIGLIKEQQIYILSY